MQFPKQFDFLSNRVLAS